MANPFVHVELATTDLAKARSFYRALFNWKLDDMDMGPGGTYTMIGVGEGTGGGMMTQMQPGAPSAWLPYVLVDDLKASTEAVKANGGTVVRDITEIPGTGSLAIISDPTGAVLGLWQPKAK
jgi:predicted enzyme related to lactoylglutathione lyase